MLETLLDMKKLEISDLALVDFEESSDSDECDSEEINRLFSNCELLRTTSISQSEYVVRVSATSETDASVVTCLSDNSCILYKINNSEIAHIQNLSGHNDKIIGCRFSATDNNLLYTGSSDGILQVWDIRNPSNSSITLTDTTSENNKTKTFNCFDVSSNDRLLTAGTDLFEGDAFLLFWDIRKSNVLGGYWESHTDDITDVKFHPNNMNTLMSGSTDSLINIYDLSQSNEDDALIDTLNTESSVEQLLWYTENGKDTVSCITHVADLQLWRLDDVKPYQHIRRAELAKAIKRKNEGYIYVASHQAKTSLLVLVGSNYEDGECIRGLRITKGQIEPSVGFSENNQRVRCSWYSENTNFLLTGGEKGLLDVWKVNKRI